MQVQSGLSAAGASHPGLQREINEDRYHYDPVRGLFIVVDGIGGQAAGEMAAETALATIRARLERETGAIDDRVREAIALANNEVHRLASLHPEWKGMACVVTVAVVANGDVVIGHVGDTRLYKLRGGRIEKLTRDHSPVGEREDAGELSERDAMQHPRRNEVYRDVGSEPHEPEDAGFIDILRQPFEPDAALLLCSDGLTDLVTTASIRDIVREYVGRPYDVVRALVDAANAAGGKDNVTAVYVEGPRFAADDDTRDLRSLHSATPPASPAPQRRPVARARTAALIVLLLVVAGLAAYAQWGRLALEAWWPALPARIAPAAAVVRTSVVGPGQSIGDAVSRATAGMTVIVEPGEYRERVALKDGVRIVSRVPRGATLRLPGGAAETDAAVIAADLQSAELSGFRILGDAATPLGIGVLVRGSSVTLSDLEIAGAHTAVEFVGGATGAIVASNLHDNGSGVVVRSGTSARIAHNAFLRGASSAAAAAIVVEPGAHPTINANTFFNLREGSVILPAGPEFAAVARDNWFISAAPAPAAGRQGRGRR